MASSFSRLAAPLAVSLALHLGAGWLFSSGHVHFLPRSGKNLTLTVTFAGNQNPAPRKPAQEPPLAAPSAPPVSAADPNISGPITEKARFLIPPDLSALEDIAVPVSGSLTLRLHVSTLGTVDRVDVMKGDPVPAELLDGLRNKFGQSRLAPALAGSQPVASTLDLVIRYETAPTPLQRDP